MNWLTFSDVKSIEKMNKELGKYTRNETLMIGDLIGRSVIYIKKIKGSAAIIYSALCLMLCVALSMGIWDGLEDFRGMNPSEFGMFLTLGVFFTSMSFIWLFDQIMAKTVLKRYVAILEKGLNIYLGLKKSNICSVSFKPDSGELFSSFNSKYEITDVFFHMMLKRNEKK